MAKFYETQRYVYLSVAINEILAIHLLKNSQTKLSTILDLLVTCSTKWCEDVLKSMKKNQVSRGNEQIWGRKAVSIWAEIT